MEPALRKSKRTKAARVNPFIHAAKRGRRRSTRSAGEHRNGWGTTIVGEQCHLSDNLQRLCTKNEIWNGYKHFGAGDIVRIADDGNEEDGYYAQIVTFLTDNYAQHYAIVIWLVPTNMAFSTNTGLQRRFDPAIFQHGFAEGRPVPISACEFICHRPNLLPYRNEWTPISALIDKIRSELFDRM